MTTETQTKQSETPSSQPPQLTHKKLSLRPSKVALFIEFLKVIIPLLIIRCILNYFSIPPYTNIFYKVFCIGLVLEMIRLYYNDEYIFSEKDITHHHGIISLNYRNVVLKYIDIRETSVSQSVLGRLLNYGNLAISTAATAGEEMICKKLDHPRELAEYLQKVISEQKKHSNLSPKNVATKDD